MPYFRAVLAEGLALERRSSTGGLRLIEESLAQIARPGWEERSHLAEVLRLKGWMLCAQGRPGRRGAELSRLARLGTRAAGEVLGIAHLDQPRAPVANPGQAQTKRTNCSRRSTTGSPKALTRRI